MGGLAGILMADGIRIQPQPARLRELGIIVAAGQLFIIRDRSRPIPQPNPNVCRICGHPHECKTYHLYLDTDCTVMVSTTIWERFLSMPDHGGFERVNVISEPPTQGIILPSATIEVTAKEF